MNSSPAKIILKPGKERSVLNFHPWIFSGAIKKTEGNPGDGDLTSVFSSDNKYLASGHFNNGSIAVRLFSWEEKKFNIEFWKEKLQKTFALRIQIGLANNPATTAFRLVNAEGDGFPGLIIDCYNNTAVIQAHSPGMYRLLPLFAELLPVISGGLIKNIFDKSRETMPVQGNEQIQNRYLAGSKEGVEIKENGLSFIADWEGGQKTGFFIDQRENRKLVQQYARHKKVLNLFSYTGGFSVYACMGEAQEVHSVDSSAKAVVLAEHNIALNHVKGIHRSFTADAFDFLKEMNNDYDLIILDPPAFAKHLSAVENAARGYQRINAIALKKIKPGGILFTFSCSQAVDKKLFRQVLFAAAAESGRTVRILHQLTQPPDHPVSIYHPEGEYLKGIVLHVA